MQDTSSQQSVSAELTEYWNRRSTLTEAEWRRFYVLVRAALLRCPASELAGLSDDKENYINEFFTDKLFFAEARGTFTLSGGALCGFFRNFLRDKLRTKPPTTDFSALDTDDGRTFEEILADERGTRTSVSDFLHTTTVATLHESAYEFLVGLEEWGRVMLRRHYCADEPIPMSTLCRDIPSYHYKSGQLGVTRGKKETSLLGYEHTLIGKWLLSLGVELKAENIEIVLFLLQVLCHLALMEENEDGVHV